ncbi:D-sedoheptulose 7-phosphate isomerase [Geomobilimonas luticola]|uniref:Phosphoheptose isomerase n=1 Tax=Geomobilimonas luticola TaxID=1114878 RepID=A0ABS5SF73_9BACT|nr:D-sedoheptulose 7-phosphate isomerase [Geomobilimonas luticola]MBT0654004.1 D-sedoheptulose 7-phosphate isomerase [Geomobilimonas luticola]
MTGEIKAQLQSHREVMELVESRLAERLEAAVELVATALSEGNKLLVMGNGGSAGDAQHLAAEIVGRFKLERRGLPAIALTTDTSILTAIGNDYGFEQVFRRQVEALAAPGDVVVGISTSGNSPNVLAALSLAREMGCRTVGFLGRDGGTIGPMVDLDLTVPSQDTPRIQEGHITMIHILCDLVERRMFGDLATNS